MGVSVRRRLIIVALAATACGCSRLPSQGTYTVDCTIPGPGGGWIDTYTIDATDRTYCTGSECSMAPVASLDHHQVVLDLYRDGKHVVTIDENTGEYRGYRESPNGDLTPLLGHCERVRMSRGFPR